MALSFRTPLTFRFAGDTSDLDASLEKLRGNFQSFLTVAAGTFAGNVLTGVAESVASIVGQVGQLKAFTQESIKLSARLDMLDVSFIQMGTNAGYTVEQLREVEANMRATGITTEAARGSLMRMIRAEIDLANASKLARLAQDAAVSANIDSSAAFDRLVLGIQRKSTLIVDDLGLTLKAGEAQAKYAETIGKSTGQLTAMEQQQAIVNNLLEQGSKIAGTYEAAMGSAGKQAGSMIRHIRNVQQELGNIFQPAYSQKILWLTDMWKTWYAWFEKNREVLTSIGDRLGNILGILLDSAPGFDGLLGGLDKVVVWIDRFLQGVEAVLTAGTQLGFALEILKAAFLGLAGAIAAVKIYSLITVAIQALLPLIGSAILAVISFASSIAAMGVTAAATQLVIMALPIAIAALIAAVVGGFAIINKSMDSFNSSLTTGTDSIGNALGEQEVMALETTRGIANRYSEMGDKIQQSMNQHSEETVDQSRSWGENLIIQFAQGMANAIAAVISVLMQLGQIIANWLAPGSPPRLLPDIDEWGAGAFTAYMDGWAEADFSVFNKLTSTLEGYLRNVLPEDDLGLIPQLLGNRSDLAGAIETMRQTGEISTDVLSSIAAQFGSVSGIVGDYITSMFNLEAANLRVADAQKKINDITTRYDAILGPLNDQLNALNAAQMDNSSAKEQARLQEIINHHLSTAEEKEAAMLELQKLQLQDQIRAAEVAQNEELTAAEDELAAAEEAQSVAQKQIKEAELLLGVHQENVSLMKEQNALLESLAESLNGAAEKAAKVGKGLGAGLSEALENIDMDAALESPFDAAADGIKERIEGLVADLKAPFDELKGDWQALGAQWMVTTALIKARIRDLSVSFLNGLEVWKGIKDNAKEIWRLLGEHWQETKDSISEKLDELQDRWEELFGKEGVWPTTIEEAKENWKKLTEKFSEWTDSFIVKLREFHSMFLDSVAPAKDLLEEFFRRVQEFWNWLQNKVFSFKIELPNIPDEWLPDSPIPLHTYWKKFGDYLKTADFTPKMDFPAGTLPTIPVSGVEAAYPRPQTIVVQNESSGGFVRDVKFEVTINDSRAMDQFLQYLSTLQDVEFSPLAST